jgi:hypothetical protein
MRVWPIPEALLTPVPMKPKIFPFVETEKKEAPLNKTLSIVIPELRLTLLVEEVPKVAVAEPTGTVEVSQLVLVFQSFVPGLESQVWASRGAEKRKTAKPARRKRFEKLLGDKCMASFLPAI